MRYLGNILGYGTGSHSSPVADDWVHVPQGGNVGTTISVRLVDLPPGNYHFQLLFGKQFLSRDGGELVPQREETVVFRSNPVKITITN